MATPVIVDAELAAVLMAMLLFERAGDRDNLFEEPTSKVSRCSLSEEVHEEGAELLWNSTRKPLVVIQIRDSNSLSTICRALREQKKKKKKEIQRKNSTLHNEIR